MADTPRHPQPEWAVAEDAVIAELAEFRPWPHGRWYVATHAENRRFNALRITDPDEFSRVDWSTTLAVARETWHPHRLPVTIQMEEEFGIDVLPGEWRRAGPTFVHVATDVADFASASDADVRLVDVASDDDVERFACLLIDTRVPEQFRESQREVARVMVRRRLNPTDATRYFLAFDGPELVGQVATLACPGGFSINHLTTVPAVRGQGYMKAIYAALSREVSGRAYGQIVDGVATLAFRERFPTTQKVARTVTYQPATDPYFGK